MRFLKAIVGLLALVSCDADMNSSSVKYEDNALTSDKVNITITATPSSASQKKENVIVQYYTKKLTVKDTGKSVYQLHGDCFINGVSIKGYTATTARSTTCSIGIF